ncbi:4Fe-4S single cluster domain-containing protein [Desulfobacter latus]|uniref:Radical SAM protein n=1 Tax=Desulfobacter latus TaxID=2292 RepID=A0A850T942_9BACT|nr:4Fe-4S single cluster domain-containing protein [Desulfobacter latus]NWH03876.1 radical SAM protein [Desulfobacter latus]
MPEEQYLNLAAYAANVHCLGPGPRVVFWVQGCCFRCPGCVAPDWRPCTPAHIVTVDALIAFCRLLTDHRGITFSGGEPMLQAMGLHKLWRGISDIHPSWDLIIFTGFTPQMLAKDERRQKFARDADALIAGPYIQAHHTETGLRGSSNQMIRFKPGGRFTENERLDIISGTRSQEVHINKDMAVIAGIPPRSGAVHKDMIEHALQKNTKKVKGWQKTVP